MNVFIAKFEDNLAILREDESWHCAKVLRKRNNEVIIVIDGFGKSYNSRLTQVHEKKCTAILLDEIPNTIIRNYYLHLAIAPTKQLDRIEWMLEKCVEIGIDEITFLQCKNSERVNLKLERITKIIESAVKQSLQATIPKINTLIAFNKFVLNCTEQNKLIAHCENSLKTKIKEIDFLNKKNLILIGPEGDFAAEEIELAHQNNFKNLSLGNTRLRTETAGIYVCQAISILTY